MVKNSSFGYCRIAFRTLNGMRRKWRCHEHCGVIVTGYRSYNSLLDVMKNFVATGTLNPINLDSYKNYYRHLTEREIEEAAKPLVEDQIK